ncbi:NAD(P)/FAD-dependent oxidoreductase [Amycolatopsis pithecellobii]|uniref:SidA/IucD/PvdA family monooxygenase n=1 Tax=Amycolatopsis pithecellobii TaxID=664692 RepID=A0A6N7YR87_9PSEU|nr:NAD(P)/FAD-dependent oxidoreductase [Amycolatopsis pithecellobii]MTD55535.1 SidA/IucD/PvdA family monooxygenase [Amycolatopsis pithecellobii]
MSSVEIARSWLERFATAIARRDADALRPLFATDSYWRDRLAFTWDLRTLHGIDRIADMIGSVLPSVDAAQFELDDAAVDLVSNGDDGQWLQASFRFTTSVGPCRGMLRLIDVETAPVAWVVYTSLEGLDTATEPIGEHRPMGAEHGDRRPLDNWADRRRAQVEFRAADPAVVVLGAGQGGLSVAARLKMLGVPTLIVERNPRVGDSWRNRYHSLVLHDPVYTNHLPYLPFPESWPVFTPKDKLADWFETYVSVLELNVWTGSEITRAQFDEKNERWSLDVRRQDGSVRTVAPRHVVLATGVSGRPRVPEHPGEGVFHGEIKHSSKVTGNEDVAGRPVLVVGAGNSGLEIAHDMWERGAEVTVVQRSSTHVSNGKNLADILFAGLYEEGAPPTEEADFLANSLPLEVAFDLQDRVLMPAVYALDADMHAGLEKAGFAWNRTGVHELFHRRGGGYYIDVGASRLIIDGRIKIKSGVEIAEFDAAGVQYTDGTHQAADLVVYATGYENMRETARELFGDGVADRCRPVWGLDGEGELSGVWRRSGFDGLWFMGGNLSLARAFSKALALQIRAIEDGVAPRHERDLPLAAADQVALS